jgi:AraC-like DNA-binding protein
LSINISDILPIIIAFQSILFAAVLLTDNGPKRISNRYLALFLILLATQFIVIVSASFGVKSDFLKSSLCIYGFSYGPLLYLYAKSLIYDGYHYDKSQLLHFGPSVVISVCSAIGFPICGSIGFFLYLSLLIYIGLAIREMVSYREVIRETQSSLNQTDLAWLQWTMIIFTCALLLDIVDQFFVSMDILANISSIHLTIVLLVNWMFYKGLKQPEIFQGISKMDEEVVRNKQSILAQNTPDSDEQIELDRIQRSMEEKEYYSNPQLNLKDLATHLDISPRHLSYLINTYFNQNFMGFVNSYRIEKAKYRLKHPNDEGETILEVMYDVGFNSKSSFFTIFKRETGLTPAAFKKKHTAKLGRK